jgi:hypothetical protein
MKKNIVIAVGMAAVVIPAVVYATGPLFINTTIDEPAPISPPTAPMDASSKMAGNEDESGVPAKLTGDFVGVGDGIHDVRGTATVIPADGQNILRLTQFQSTNGPDLYVYLASGGDASDFVNLGKLKANIGNQNYEVAEGTDFSKYDTVLIWCQQFSVLFGSAPLTTI